MVAEAVSVVVSAEARVSVVSVEVGLVVAEPLAGSSGQYLADLQWADETGSTSGGPRCRQ